jgi:hypothetical protein
MVEPKEKDPAAVALGAKGGKVKTAKGFATMDPERAEELRRKSAETRRKKSEEQQKKSLQSATAYTDN